MREIEVFGNSQKSIAEIAGMSGVSLGMNIFKVDKNEIERNFSASSYVELVNAEVQMPDTVRLEVRERKACAALNCAGVILLIDREGYILERTTSLPQKDNLIVISGMDVTVNSQSRMVESGVAGQTALMKRLLEALGEEQAEKLIAELNVTDPDNLYLVSHTGVQILIGDEEQLSAKLMWMRAVLEELTKNGVMKGVLDVSSGKNAVYAEN